MKFWIESGKRETKLKFENFEFAEEFLSNAAKNLIKDYSESEYWLKDFLYVDLIRIKQIEQANNLRITKSLNKNPNFKLAELRAKVATEDLRTLLQELTIHKDYGAAIIAHRLIEEGNTNQLLKNINLNQIEYNAQKEILILINRYEKDLNLAAELYEKVKNSDAYDNSIFGIDYIICDKIESGEISFNDGLKLLKKIPLSDRQLFSLATSSVRSGNAEMYKESLIHLKDDHNRNWNISNYLKDEFFYQSEEFKHQIMNVIREQKLNKEVKLLLEIIELASQSFAKTKDDLTELCKKYKKYQLEDFVCRHLIFKNEFKKCVNFIDRTQGRNRFGFYQSCLTNILKNGDSDFVINKLDMIKDNFTRSEITNAFLHNSKYELAEKLRMKFFKNKKKRIEFLDQHFLKYYVRNHQKEKANQLIENQNSLSGSIGIYHQLGRMSMGLIYGSTG